MGLAIYESGVRTAWRSMMRVAEHRIGNAGELGRPLERLATDAPPVLLVHGYGNSSATMGAIERSLQRDGFRAYSMTLPEHGFGDAMADASVVGKKIEEIRTATGAAHVDIVGHSRGGLVARGWQQLLDQHGTTGRVVTVSSANQGIALGAVDGIFGRALPDGMQQIRAGAQLIDDLHATRGAHDVIAVGTKGIDGVLVPAAASKIEGAPFVAIDEGRTIGPMSRVGHYGILRDDTAYEAIRRALLTGRG